MDVAENEGHNHDSHLSCGYNRTALRFANKATVSVKIFRAEKRANLRKSDVNKRLYFQQQQPMPSLAGVKAEYRCSWKYEF